jgi:hypothetical protein
MPHPKMHAVMTQRKSYGVNIEKSSHDTCRKNRSGRQVACQLRINNSLNACLARIETTFF